MTAAQVKALLIGDTVSIQKEGHEPVLCVVAFRGKPGNKFLTYRDRGQVKAFAIKDYPGLNYFK